jgi:hypothetical protein
MKKVVVTIQMLALIAMFPVYLLMELNHETGKLPISNSSSESIERLKENNIQPALNLKDKGREIFDFALSVKTK